MFNTPNSMIKKIALLGSILSISGFVFYAFYLLLNGYSTVNILTLLAFFAAFLSHFITYKHFKNGKDD